MRELYLLHIERWIDICIYHQAAGGVSGKLIGTRPDPKQASPPMLPVGVAPAPAKLPTPRYTIKHIYIYIYINSESPTGRPTTLAGPGSPYRHIHRNGYT